MTISATILEDSISPTGVRVTTFLANYPRMIHPEVLRDRRMSHSVSSSRAVPVMRLLRRVIEDAAEPVEWGSNQPGMQAGALAVEMQRAMNESLPKELKPGEWHLPLVTWIERLKYHTNILRDISAARCARSSYLNHDKSDPLISLDLDLAKRLRKQHHWSPFEHQASPDSFQTVDGEVIYDNPHLHGNLPGWTQNRKFLEVRA